MTAELFNGKQLAQQYEKMSAEEFGNWLQSELDTIKIKSTNTCSIGRTLSEIADDMKAEYLRREEGKSFKSFPTPWASLNREIGGLYTGDIYGIMAESGRGKTYVTCSLVDELLRQGATVLAKSFEVKEYVWIARLVSIATAKDEVFENELGQAVGLPNKAILGGKLEDVVRENFMLILEKLHAYYPGTLYFQGKSGDELTRSLDDLERELSTTQIDAVVLDPFYGLSDVYDGRKNANRTAGGSAEVAATRFENICGDKDVIGIYTVQADIKAKSTDEGGTRELVIPTREHVKTTKRLLDIATVLFGFDSVEKEGIAALGVEKGRNGGEDFVLNLMALLDYGVLREFPSGPESVAQFADPTSDF